MRTLSGGQLRRLDLALALVGDPDLLFLDEPTTGFDPNARRDAWQMIAGLRSSGTTVLLTSHYLDEVQHLADRIGVMSHGRLVEESTPDALGGRDIAGTVISFRLPAALAGAELPAGPWDEPERHDGEIIMRTDQPTRALLALTSWAVGLGMELDSAERGPAVPGRGLPADHRRSHGRRRPWPIALSAGPGQPCCCRPARSAIS